LRIQVMAHQEGDKEYPVRYRLKVFNHNDGVWNFGDDTHGVGDFVLTLRSWHTRGTHVHLMLYIDQLKAGNSPTGLPYAAEIVSLRFST
jgi:hypothetical protein